MPIVRCLFALLLLLPMPIWGDPSPSEVVQQFYKLKFEMKLDGLPDETQLEQLTPYLSDELISLIKAAQKEQAEFIQKNPDEKPPWIEGDLFSSLFEGPSGFEPGDMEEKGDAISVRINFHYINPDNSAEIVRWVDTVILKKADKGYVIQDLLYGGDWEFRPGNRLTEVLQNR